VNASRFATPGWRWIADEVADATWSFFDCTPRNGLERTVKRPEVVRYRCAAQASLAAKRKHADLVVSHLPLMTAPIALLLRMLSVDTQHLAFAFNFTDLPKGMRRRAWTSAFSRVDRLVVPSTLERSLYANYFELPLERIEMLRFAVDEPVLPTGTEPLVEGRYVCALGSQGRDYATLFKAAESLPHITFAVVASRASIAGLEVPANVRMWHDVPLEIAWNVLRFAQFMVLPLRDSEVPCGHVTLATAMLDGKAFVATESEGISDYATNDWNALLVGAHSADALREAIVRLWNDEGHRRSLEEHSLQFGREHCSQARVVSWFRDYLKRSDLL
jgi:glycosyltransferase involved in cell wall biosynthesis